MPTRNGSTSNYRYGFQGQEKDDEVKGNGNSINYKFRMHDPRVGRFFATDPLEMKYTNYSPYSFSGNKVIHRIELEGLEDAKFNTTLYDPVLRNMSPEDRKQYNKQFEPFLMPIVETLAGFIPWVGQGIDVKDSYDAYNGGSGWDKVFATAAWIPGFDLFKGIRKVIKGTDKVADGAKSLNKLEDAVPDISKIDDAVKGGKYGALEPKSVTGKEKHHIPANSVSPLSTYKGGAVQIDPSDHKLTGSYGSSKSAKAYRAKQKELIDSGDFEGAFEMDVKDLKSKFGDKYDGAIEQTREYYKSEGVIIN